MSGIMGFIEGPPAPKPIPAPPFFISNFKFSQDISSQQVKFERKSIVSSISIELP